MVELTQIGAANEPDNAFWRQSEAVFQERLGNIEVSRESWKIASLARTWDDYQTAHREKLIDDLETEYGRRLAWHVAVAKSLKSSTASRSLLAFARRLHTEEEQAHDLELRLATLRNGVLLRDGSRSSEAW